MNFGLSEEQRAFADMAQGLFADYCTDDALRRHDLSDAPFHRALWDQCVQAGLHSIVVPEALGGLGLGLTELMAVLEQQGAALALVPLWEQQLVAATLAQCTAPAWHTPIIEGLLGGELVALSLAAAAQTQGASLRLRQGATGWHLEGSVPALALGSVAQQALLLAVSADEAGAPLRLVMVRLDQPGVTRHSGRSQHHLDVADLEFQAVAVATDAVLPTAATAWLEVRATAALAALQMGVTQQQLRRTVDYVSQRRQFERVIGSFQMVAGQMADGHIALEALRASVWQLVYRIDAGLPAVPHALATRALANDTGHRVGHMAQHVHGGIGVDLTYPIHRYLYWSRALAASLGGTEHQYARLGDWLADNDNLGWKYDLAEPA